MVLDEICSRTNFSFNILLHPTTKKTCWILLKSFTIQHLISNTILNVAFNVFKRSNVYSNVFIKYNKKWSYSISSQFYSANILNSSDSLQPFTPEICFGSSHFLSSFWSILLFSHDEVFHNLNWQALVRPSQLHPCTSPFWK